MLHKRLYYVKDGALVKSWAPMPAQKLVELTISDTSEEQESPKKTSCKEKVLQVVEPMLTPIAQAVAEHESKLKELESSKADATRLTPISQSIFKYESKLKELESSKLDASYFEDMLEIISKAITNQQKEIDELIASQQSKAAEKPVGGPVGPVACVLPNQMAFLLKFSTQQDFEKAEPCLRSLSDLLERNDVNFELIEL